MTILEKIIRQKEKEIVELKKQTFDITQVKKPAYNIAQAFKESAQMNVIAEIKRSSPSKGDISSNVNPVAQAKNYAAYGAGAISVLTDKTFFNGSMDDLRTVHEAVDLPLLCKDFMIDPVQIDQAKANGASMILLIVAALSVPSLKEMYDYATDQELEVLCEVHNETEMERALELGAPIIGINNRDLKTFKVDLKTTGKLASMVQNPDTILISESGIKTQADVKQVAEHGADGILVGETLMRSDNLLVTFSDLRIPFTKEQLNNAR